MSKVRTIAWREFKQTVFRPVFLLAIIGMPVLIGGILVLSVFLAATYEEAPLVGTIAVVDADGDLTEAATDEFSPSRIERDHKQQIQDSVDRMQSGAASKAPDIGGMPNLKRGEIDIHIERVSPDQTGPAHESLREKVREGQWLAAAVIDPSLLVPRSLLAEQHSTTTEGDASSHTRVVDDDSQPHQFVLFVAPDLKSEHVRLIERRLGESVVRVRANRAGLDPDAAMAMLRRPDSNTQRLLESGEETAETEMTRVVKQMIPMAFMGLIFLGVFASGNHLLMSTIEEKSNRVMEVLLSAASPMQLMTGKIFGHGAVGLLLVAVYGAVGIAGLIAASATHFIDALMFVYLTLYFFMGYFMVASMFAAVGAAVTDIREANTLITPAMLLVWIPWMLWFPISQDPNGAVGTVFSFVPPIMPFVMILRVCADEPVPLWQIPATIVWGYICVVAMMWMAAKIFRVGVLMYGKPPSPLQLIKWLRYA